MASETPSPPSAGSHRLGHVPALDGLRGLAVLLVIGYHAFNWPRNGGDVGVGIFFVLSGFLITTLLLEEFAATQTIRLRRFYARRALRLFPLLYLVLVVIALSIPFMSSPTDRSLYAHSLLWCALYVGDFFGVIGRFHALAPATGHLWSLAVEEQFYLVWPALLLWLVRGKRSARLLRYVWGFSVVAILVRAGLLVDGKTIWTLPSTHADALLAGCGLAILRRQGRLVWMMARPLLLPGVVALALALVVFSPRIQPTVALGAGYILIALLGLGLVVVALGGAAPLLAGRPLVYCGRISYGLYVMNPVLLAGADATLTGLPHWLRIVAAIVASFLLAAASRQWFEGYFLGLKHRFDPPSVSSGAAGAGTLAEP
jgi:peptidoglycan/LPS O-acetylase OafA/YrhL